MEAAHVAERVQVQQKREIEKNQELTVAGAILHARSGHLRGRLCPNRGSGNARTDKNNVDVTVEDDLLTVEGRLDFSKYEGMQPVYSEYNIGNYRRSFSLSNKIDQTKISADMSDGVLTVTLPKSEAAKAKRIAIG